jgi:hypothetical protein
MSRIIVEYKPNISDASKRAIEDNMDFTMISHDEQTRHYEINKVADILIAQEELVNQRDLHLINDLIFQGTHYIEF